MLKYSQIQHHNNLVEWADKVELVENYTLAEIKQCLKGETTIVQGKRKTFLNKRRLLHECMDQDDYDISMSSTLQQSDKKLQNGDTTLVFKMTFGARSLAPQKPSSVAYHRSRTKHADQNLKLLRCSVSHYFCVKYPFYCLPYSTQTYEHVPLDLMRNDIKSTDGYQADESDTNENYLEAVGDTEICRVKLYYMELLFRKLSENPSKLDGPLKSQKFTAKSCTGGNDGGNNYTPQDYRQRAKNRGKSRRSLMLELSMIGHGDSEPSSDNQQLTTDTSVNLHPTETEEEEPSTETDTAKKPEPTKKSNSKAPTKKVSSVPTAAPPRTSTAKPSPQTTAQRALMLKQFALSTWKTRSTEDLVVPKAAPPPKMPGSAVKKLEPVPKPPVPEAVAATVIPIPAPSEMPHVDYAFELARRSSVLTEISASSKRAKKIINPDPVSASVPPVKTSIDMDAVAASLKPKKKLKSKSSLEESMAENWESATHDGTSYLAKASFSSESGIVLKKDGSFPKISRSFQTIIHSVDQVEKWKKEKDKEWLELSKEDNEEQSHIEIWDLIERSPSQIQRIEPEVQQFLTCQRWLVMAMTIFGVYPYNHVATSGKCVRVIWAKKSLKMVMFFLFTVLCGVTLTCMIWSMMRKSIILQPTELEAIYDVEFQKYVVEGLWIMLSLTFLSIWSISVLSEMGRHQAEFMTRLFYSINLLKYTVSDKIVAIIRNQLCVLASVIVVLGGLVFFGGDVIPTPREACGFFAILIFRHWDDKLRTRAYFYGVEILGYFIFVWVHVSMSLVLLHFVVVAKALKNMARMFNVRLAYRLGKISLDKLDPTQVNIVRNIPFEKLHAERLVIASLIKQMGYTHSVAINLYVCIAGAEMILFLYGNSHQRNNTLNSSFAASPYTLAYPLRLSESGPEIVFKNLAYVTYFLYVSILFMNSLNQVGYVFGIGKDYVRKYGLVHCKSGSERRFIMSMLGLDHPKLTHFIGIRLSINREFLAGMLAVIGFFWAIFMLYNPVRLEVKRYTECNNNGICTTISYSKGTGKHPIFMTPPRQQMPQQTEYIRTPPPLIISTTVLPPLTTPPPPNMVLNFPPNWFTNETYPYGKGIHEGSIPHYIIFQSVNYSTSIKTKPTIFALPNIFKLHNTSGQVYYEILQREIKNTSGAVIPSHSHGAWNNFQNIYHPDQVQNEIRVNNTIFYGGGFKTKPLKHDQFDDCGNPWARLAGTGKKVEDPNTTLVSTDTLPGGKIGSEMYLCCYQYRRDTGTKRAYRYCNMPNLDALHAQCNETTNVKGKRYVNVLKALRRSRLPHKDVLDDSILRVIFKDCICRGRDITIYPSRSDSTCDSYVLPG